MMEEYTSRKIYINPHFNKNTSLPSGSGHSDKTYININHPSFSLGQRKIYINPNFLPPNPLAYIERNILLLASQQNQAHSTPPPSPTDFVHKSKYSIVKSASFINANKQIAQANKEQNTNMKLIDNSQEIPLVNSQYRIVRNKKQPPFDSSDTRRYRNITLTHPTPPVNASVNTFNYTEQPFERSENRYMSSGRYRGRAYNRRAYYKNFKRNKIPCRLFTKFGKCVRFSYGKCNYLHDKKYVSLCKKYLKGFCYDLDCTLSHELSFNKMPTCYFYLKGMCAKEECPYLHIKLSDKAKICREFLKGYCKNADMCSFRHVTKYRPKRFRNRKLKRSMSYYDDTVLSNEFKITESIEDNIDEPEDESSEIERRYYNETFDTEDDVEFIQPSRCTLGTLPSFIHL